MMVSYGRNFEDGIEYNETMENAISKIEEVYGESNGEPDHTMDNQYGDELETAAEALDEMDDW